MVTTVLFCKLAMLPKRNNTAIIYNSWLNISVFNLQMENVYHFYFNLNGKWLMFKDFDCDPQPRFKYELSKYLNL